MELSSASKTARIAARASADQIRSQIELLGKDEHISALYNCLSEIVLILNSCNQIVLFNDRLTEILDISVPDDIYGKRPGEIFSCLHAGETAHGCGSSESCLECGAASAIAAAGQGRGDLQECRILCGNNNEAADFLIRTTPLKFKGQSFCVVAITDISDAKRRNALERLFFHDMLNTASALKMLVELLNAKKGDRAELARDIKTTVHKLLEDINSHRDLAAAESNDLLVRPARIRSLSLLGELAELLKHHVVCKDRRIVIDPASVDVTFISDHALLTRVLCNMLKNALEATMPGRDVTVGCDETGGQVVFRVHNHQYMKRNVQLQLFKRSFSTKGPGRGLGTYSMKLLTGLYLDGQIDFETSCEKGTTFYARYPLDGPDRP